MCLPRLFMLHAALFSSNFPANDKPGATLLPHTSHPDGTLIPAPQQRHQCPHALRACVHMAAAIGSFYDSKLTWRMHSTIQGRGGYGVACLGRLYCASVACGAVVAGKAGRVRKRYSKEIDVN